MYKRILAALENSKADDSLIPHIKQLAKLCSAEIILLHVADGWAARHYETLQLNESQEMQDDRAYLESLAESCRADGIPARPELALGNPPTEILRTAEREHCDLIAMTTHGHRLIGDLVFGSTISQVRHRSNIPILLVRAQSAEKEEHLK